jgi:alpha-L-rhamnosidase
MLKFLKLTTEYRKNPLGIDVSTPRFSWVFDSDQNNTVQKSYTVKVSGNGSIAWDSGVVESGQSVLIEYAGAPLVASTRYRVEVSVTDNHGEKAKAEGWFETGLLKGENFMSKWITHPFEDDVEPCPVFVKEFALTDKMVKSARIYASALGLYELSLNGSKVGDAFFAPGWTNYRKRIQYQTYDITGMLQENNRLEITTAGGWYQGVFGVFNKPHNYGTRTAVIAQIRIEHQDGSIETIISDESWGCTIGKRRSSEIYNGEIIDNTFVSESEKAVTVIEHPKNVLVCQESDPVRITQRLAVKELIITPNGEAVLDFGQNIAGVVEARLNCPCGTKITLRHAEVLDKNGNFYTENLREAKATDTFICAGTGEEVFLPAFTFHGFRYVHIEGLGTEIDICRFTACVLHTDMPETGCFSCSNDGINQLQSNIKWGQRSNFLDIPTDCPQRNERFGWTGDAQMFSSTAAYNMNVALFFTKWLRDLAVEQTTESGVPHIVPNILGEHEGSAAWAMRQPLSPGHCTAPMVMSACSANSTPA